jgi:hypothetical protein
MKKSNEPPGQSNSLELELPDFSGMEDSGLKIAPETAFQLSEEYQHRFSGVIKNHRLTLPPPCDVEFRL